MSRHDGVAATGDLPPVGVVIPVWNAREYTLACLDSLAGLRYPNRMVVVVDNGSEDGSSEAIAAAHSEVAIIRNEANLGFARACNQGLEQVFAMGAAYALLLNNDTTVDPDMLTRLVAAAQAHPAAGILAPTIYYQERPDLPWFTGMRFSRPIYIVRTDRRHQVQAETPTPVDFVSGCGMLIARRVYEQVGGLDDAYFMYYEDLDYCLRARKAGYEILYVPDAAMWHALSVSSGGKDAPIKQYHQIKSSLIFYRRHTRGLWRWLNLSIRFSHAASVATRHAIRGRLNPEAVRAYLRGIREA